MNYIIVGRPNVGKTSIFNFLIGRNEGVVRDEYGTTVDLRSNVINGVRLWDSPGIEKVEKWPIDPDLVLFVIDNVALNCDKEMFLRLKRTGKKIITIVNKIDLGIEDYSFFGEHILVSISKKIGVRSLFDIFVQESDAPRKKIWAVIGRPNVGKSSLINILFGADLHKVEDKAGTTREFLPVDIDETVFLDTPGQNRQIAMPRNWNVFGVIVVVDVIKARQDLRLIGMAVEHKKPVLVVINKIDLAFENEYIAIEQKIKQLFDVPIVRISCLKPAKIKQLLENQMRHLEEKFVSRIKTSELNVWANEIKKVEPRLKYISQVETAPPLFFLDARVTVDIERMMRRRLIRHFGLLGIPIGFTFAGR